MHVLDALGDFSDLIVATVSCCLEVGYLWRWCGQPCGKNRPPNPSRSSANKDTQGLTNQNTCNELSTGCPAGPVSSGEAKSVTELVIVLPVICFSSAGLCGPVANSSRFSSTQLSSVVPNNHISILRS